MTAQENTQIIQNIYAAFGQGNIPAILNALASEVEWVADGAPFLPFAGAYRGPQQVGEFFKKLVEHEEFLAFEPQEFVAQGGTVVALGHVKTRVKATGKSWESQWAMTWHLQGGKVKKFHDFFDTALAAEAFRKN